MPLPTYFTHKKSNILREKISSGKRRPGISRLVLGTRLLGTGTWNRHLEQAPWNRHLEQAPWNRLLEQAPGTSTWNRRLRAGT
ncbi:MAG: hypothetical protein LC132_07480 [Burkholderiales bacterium]|nr:hypothetical protein [Burkholderiales bacterium]